MAENFLIFTKLFATKLKVFMKKVLKFLLVSAQRFCSIDALFCCGCWSFKRGRFDSFILILELKNFWFVCRDKTALVAILCFC